MKLKRTLMTMKNKPMSPKSGMTDIKSVGSIGHSSVRVNRISMSDKRLPKDLQEKKIVQMLRKKKEGLQLKKDLAINKLMQELEEIERKEQTVFDRIVLLEGENQTMAATRKDFSDIGNGSTGY
jgi:hypothetical protein